VNKEDGILTLTTHNLPDDHDQFGVMQKVHIAENGRITQIDFFAQNAQNEFFSNGTIRLKYGAGGRLIAITDDALPYRYWEYTYHKVKDNELKEKELVVRTEYEKVKNGTWRIVGLPQFRPIIYIPNTPQIPVEFVLEKNGEIYDGFPKAANAQEIAYMHTSNGNIVPVPGSNKYGLDIPQVLTIPLAPTTLQHASAY